MNPLLYDFKRTFIRFSTLFFLAIFIVAGVGLSFLVYQYTISQQKSQYVHINDIAVIKVSGENYTALIYVFDNLGNPVPTAEVEVRTSKVYSTLTNASGFAKLSFPRSINGTIKVTYKGESINQSFSFLGLSEGVTFHASAFTSGVGVFQPSFERIISIGISGVSVSPVISPVIPILYTLVPAAYVITASNGGKAVLVIGSIVKNITIHYAFSSKYNETNLNNTLLLKDYINVVTINVPEEPRYFVAESKDLGIYNSSYTLYLPHGTALTQVFLSIGSYVGLFTGFFPVIMLYLAYVMLAKPRESGALLFLLSKPITRGQLYLNRFLGGALTALLASLIFWTLGYLIINYWIYTSTGVSIPINFLILSFVATLVNLVAFYSLVLVLPTFIKSAGWNIGISVILYVFFSVIFGIIALAIGGINRVEEVSYKLDYLNPLQLGSLITYFLAKEYLITSSYSFISPPLIIIAVLAWVIIPLMVGIWRIQKIDI